MRDRFKENENDLDEPEYIVTKDDDTSWISKLRNAKKIYIKNSGVFKSPTYRNKYGVICGESLEIINIDETTITLSTNSIQAKFTYSEFNELIYSYKIDIECIYIKLNLSAKDFITHMDDESLNNNIEYVY
jgi:hypothetical protein